MHCSDCHVMYSWMLLPSLVLFSKVLILFFFVSKVLPGFIVSTLYICCLVHHSSWFSFCLNAEISLFQLFYFIFQIFPENNRYLAKFWLHQNWPGSYCSHHLPYCERKGSEHNFEIIVLKCQVHRLSCHKLYIYMHSLWNFKW